MSAVETDASPMEETDGLYKTFHSVEEFKKCLLQISDDLKKAEVQRMTYLCKTQLGAVAVEEICGAPRENKKPDASKLFDYLEKLNLCNKDDFKILCEMLYYIRKMNLLKFLVNDSEKVKSEIRRKPTILKPFRIILDLITNSLEKDDFKKMQSQYEGHEELSRIDVRQCMAIEDLFILLEDEDIISEKEVHKLGIMMQHLGRDDLAEVVKRYAYLKESDPYLGSIHPSSVLAMQKNVTQSLPVEERPSDIGVYQLDKPGLCLIFNIMNYSKVGASSDHATKERRGSNEDAVGLYKCFSGFGFEVGTYWDSTFVEMRDHLLTAREDLKTGSYSSFICCILAHGKEQTIITSDQQEYKLKAIAELFNGVHTPEMVGKPKIFIIQACQGREIQAIPDD